MFPVAIAPYPVILLNLGVNDEQITAVSEQLYEELQAADIDVLYDDRDERPGFKFKDADLLGVPYRLTVGKNFVKSGLVELRHRNDGSVEELSPKDAVVKLTESIRAAVKA